MPVTATRPPACSIVADVADLAAAPGMERRAVEHDPPGRASTTDGAVLVQVGLLVTQVDGHGPNLSMCHADGGTITTGHGALRSNRPASPAGATASPTTIDRPRVEVAGQADVGPAGDDGVEPPDGPWQVVRHPAQVGRHRHVERRPIGLGDLDHRQLDVEQRGQRRRRERQLLEARPPSAEPDEHPPHRLGRRPPASADDEQRHGADGVGDRRVVAVIARRSTAGHPTTSDTTRPPRARRRRPATPTCSAPAATAAAQRASSSVSRFVRMDVVGRRRRRTRCRGPVWRARVTAIVVVASGPAVVVDGHGEPGSITVRTTGVPHGDIVAAPGSRHAPMPSCSVSGCAGVTP